jgi:hypothetical protein
MTNILTVLSAERGNVNLKYVQFLGLCDTAFKMIGRELKKTDAVMSDKYRNNVDASSNYFHP